MKIKNKILLYIIVLISQIFLLSNNVSAEVISVNTTISTDTTYASLVIQNGATLTLDAVLTVTGDATIELGGILTHTSAATTNSNLIVGGTLDIQTGGKIDVSEKGKSTEGFGLLQEGGSHGGYGASSSSKEPYGDIYNPITTGSYGRSASYQGGGLVRMTVGNLINNGAILSNGKSTNTRGLGSGGSINILVNGLVSGNGLYQANGGGGNYVYANGGGGRIAIKYNSVADLNNLKNNTSATGPNMAGEGTIYLKNNTTGIDYLLIKGGGVSGKNTGVGTGYEDYYFDTIEVTDGAKLYQIGAETIAASSCITGGTPIGEIDSNIICDGNTSFRYYDLVVSVGLFSIKDRKYEYIVEGPVGGATLMGTSTGVINGNGTLTNRIKLTRLGNYTFSFDLYDGILEDSIIEGSAVKNVIVSDQ